VKLYIDLETLDLIAGPGFRNPISSLRFKRGDSALLEVAFLTGGATATSIGDPDDMELQFGVKPRGRYDVAYLCHTADWTMPAPDAVSPVYQCSPSFNTVELDSALGVGSSTGTELSEITLMGEITWREGAGQPTSSRTFYVIVENDVNRGTEGIPTDADPAYPAPQSLALLTQVVRHDAAQTLDTAHRLQARANIGLDAYESLAASAPTITRTGGLSTGVNMLVCPSRRPVFLSHAGAWDSVVANGPWLEHISIADNAALSTLTALTFGDLVGCAGAISIKDCPQLVTLAFPELLFTATFSLTSMTSLASISLPKLFGMTGTLTFTATGNTALTTVSCPAMRYCGGVNFTSSTNFLNLATISLPELETTFGSFQITNCPAVTSFSAPKFHSSGGVVAITGAAGATGFTTISFPALANVYQGMTLAGPYVTTISLPSLRCCSDLVAFSNLTVITDISLPALERIGTSLSVGSTTMPALLTLSLPVLTTIGTFLTLANVAALTTLSLPSIVTIGGTITITAANMTTVVLGTSLTTCASNFAITGAKLTAQSVENILVALAGCTSFAAGKTVNLSGGTSSGLAALTGPAITARNTLLARSVTVTLNA
jgi:hypothetical protein